MANLRLKTLSIEPTQDLVIQNGNTTFTYTTPSTSAINGSVVFNGGISIQNTTDATSHTAGGALTINGGVGILEHTFLGKHLTMESNSSILSVSGTSTERFFIDTVTNQQIRLAPDGITNRMILTNTDLSLYATKNAENTSTGSLVVNGGIAIQTTDNTSSLGVGGSINSAGGISIQGRTFLGDQLFVQGNNNTSEIILGPAPDSNNFNYSSQIKSVSNTSTDFSSTLEFYTHEISTGTSGTLQMTINPSGDIHVKSQNNAINSSTGALQVSGGISTRQKSFFGDQIRINTNYTNNTSSHLLLENSNNDTPGINANTQVILHSKSDGKGILQFKNTLNTTTNSMSITHSSPTLNNSYLSFLAENSTIINLYNTGILELLNTNPSNSSTTGSLIIKGGIGIEKESFFKSKTHFDNIIEFNGLSQTYHIIGGGDTPNGLAFTGKNSNTSSSYNYFTTDGDSTDNIAIKMFSLGTPNNITNSESLEFVWDSTTSIYRISSNSLGTGNIHSIHIESGSTNQFVIGTSGNLSINSTETNHQLNINGTLNVNNIVTFTATENSDSLTTGSLQVSGGIAASGNNYFNGNTLQHGSITLDLNSTYALLVQNTNSNHVFSVDTINQNTQVHGTLQVTTFGKGIQTHNLTNNLWFDVTSNETIGSHAFTNQDHTLLYTPGNNNGSSNIPIISYNSNTTIFTSTQNIIETTNTQALLVRKINNTGNIFNVDTTNEKIEAKSRNPDAPLSVRTISSNTTNIEPILELQRDPNEFNDELYGDGSIASIRNISSIQFTNRTFRSSGSHKTNAIKFYSTGVGEPSNIGLNYGYTTIESTISSTSPSTGALTVLGGTGISGNLNIGGNFISNKITSNSTENALNQTTGSLILSGGITIQTTTNSTNLNNGGGLLLLGGASINKNLYLGQNLINTGTIQMKGTSNTDFIQFFDSTNTQRWVIGQNNSNHLFINRYNTSGILLEESFGINIGNGKTTLSNTSQSISSTDAALVISGGISIATTGNSINVDHGGSITTAGGLAVKKDTYIGGIVSFTNTINASNPNSGSLVINGGTGISKDLYVGGNTTLYGNLTILGTTTSISTTQTLLEDNIIVFNSGPAGTSDAGFLIERFQNSNDTGNGDVVNDPFTISETLPSQSSTTSTTTILHPGASTFNNFYINWWIKITSGFSANQVRKIINYNGTTKIITIDSPWTTQNPSNGDSFELFNKPFVGMIYNEIQNQFHLVGTNINPITETNINYIDEIDLYTRNITLTGTKNSTSLDSASLYTHGGATFAGTVEATSITSGGSLTTGGGAAIGKNLIVGTHLTVNGTNFTPNTEDIYTENTFSGNNNQNTFTNLTGLSFNNNNTGAFDAYVYTKILANTNLYSHFHLRGIQKESTWEISTTYIGDSTNITFTITNTGQIQYTSANYSGFTSLTFKFRALTITI